MLSCGIFDIMEVLECLGGWWGFGWGYLLLVWFWFALLVDFIGFGALLKFLLFIFWVLVVSEFDLFPDNFVIILISFSNQHRLQLRIRLNKNNPPIQHQNTIQKTQLIKNPLLPNPTQLLQRLFMQNLLLNNFLRYS